MKGGSQIGLEKLRISLSARARDDLARRETLLTPRETYRHANDTVSPLCIYLGKFKAALYKS